jgi:hypothetical protein
MPVASAAPARNNSGILVLTGLSIMLRVKYSSTTKAEDTRFVTADI